MRVEITEKKLRDAGYDLREGDTITVPADTGKRWCELGWAKDTEGKVATGERKVIGAELLPAKATHTSKSKEG